MRYREIMGANDQADRRLREVLSPEEYADVQRLIGAFSASKVSGMGRLPPSVVLASSSMSVPPIGVTSAPFPDPPGALVAGASPPVQ